MNEHEKKEEERDWGIWEGVSGLIIRGLLILILISILIFGVLFSCDFIKINSFLKLLYQSNKVEATETTTKVESAQVDKVAVVTETTKSQESTTTISETEKPLVIEPGFDPDSSLIDISKEVNFPKIPKDSVVFKDYRGFCDVTGIWGKPRAGYNDGFNDEFSSSDRRRNVQIPTWKWLIFTGEEGWFPGVGSIKDPDGGAILLAVINVWETPGEFTNAYLLHGFWGFGEVWDMSDMIDNADYSQPKYGEYTLGTLATIRNHYINQLGSTDPNPEFRGQTGERTQARTITWVCILRWYDGTFRLVSNGQWIRGQ